MKTSRKIFWSVFLGVPAIAAALLLYAFFIEPARLTVREYDLKIENWSARLDGFRIVAISDLHGGANFITEAKIRRVVEEANAREPDLIVLLGDYVSQQAGDRTKLKMPVETVAENLKGLRARCGVYAVLGNHDGWYSIPKVRRALEAAGYRVLENEAVTLEKDGAKLRLVGLPDSLSTNVPENKIPNARAGIELLENKEGSVIAVAHNPDDLENVTEKASPSPDLALFIAGHTHGGQVRLPFVGALVVPTKLGRKYANGPFLLKNVNVFITPGVGTSIIPVRFGVPPEISVLNIKTR